MDTEERREEREAIHRFLNPREPDPTGFPERVSWVTVQYEQIGDDEGTRIRLSRPVRVL